MKAYAIICEYGACSIHESIEMVCKTEKIARPLLREHSPIPPLREL